MFIDLSKISSQNPGKYVVQKSHEIFLSMSLKVELLDDCIFVGTLH